MGTRLGTRVALEAGAATVGLAAGGVAYLAAAPLWAPPVAAVAGWGLTRLLARILMRPSTASSLPVPTWDAEFGRLRAARKRILELATGAKDPAVRERGSAIVASLGRVMAHIQQDPHDLDASRRFLDVYMERTKAILGRYMQYESLDTPEAAEVRAKVRDELLPALLRLCDEQLERITSDDMRSFETDVDVLRKSIELEGL